VSNVVFALCAVGLAEAFGMRVEGLTWELAIYLALFIDLCRVVLVAVRIAQRSRRVG
jgi:hypothetical protein